jgi:N-acyl-D-aspartate/D-glutamate deacylase
VTTERLLVHGGTVIDGSGGEPSVAADVLLADGIIAAVGTDRYGLICDSSFPTFLLGYWGRDRTRGERLPVPSVVKSLTSEAATAVGLNDRGLIRPGYKADLNLIEFDALTLHVPQVRHDPAPSAFHEFPHHPPDHGGQARWPRLRTAADRPAPALHRPTPPGARPRTRPAAGRPR